MSEIDLAGSWPEVISQLLARKDLSASHAGAAMRSVLSGEATPSQITAFIVALRAKGETEIELEGMLAEVRRAAERVFLPDEISQRALDIEALRCGAHDAPHVFFRPQQKRPVHEGFHIAVIRHFLREVRKQEGAVRLQHLQAALRELDGNFEHTLLFDTRLFGLWFAVGRRLCLLALLFLFRRVRCANHTVL